MSPRPAPHLLVAAACAGAAACFSSDAGATDPGFNMGGPPIPPSPELLAPPAPERPPLPGSVRPVDWEFGGIFSYLSPPIRGGTTPFGAGLGGRIGFVVSDLYVGGKVVYYFGGSDVDLSDSSVLAGVDLGYTFRLLPLRKGYFGLRPELGIGDAIVSHSDPSTVRVDVVSSASGRGSRTTLSDTVVVHGFYTAPALRAVLVFDNHLFGLSGGTLLLPRISYGADSEPATWLSYGFQAEAGFAF